MSGGMWDLYESDRFDAREKELNAQMALHYSGADRGGG